MTIKYTYCPVDLHFDINIIQFPINNRKKAVPVLVHGQWDKCRPIYAAFYQLETHHQDQS